VDLAKAVYGAVRHVLIAGIAGRNLRKLSGRLESPEDAVDLAFSFKNIVHDLLMKLVRLPCLQGC